MIRNHHPTELIVALDFDSPEDSFHLTEKLQGLPVIYKVGFEQFLSGGPQFVRELVHRKFRIFLDLKFHDIPNTVARAALQAAKLHAEIFTVHLSGGRSMVRAAADALGEISEIRPKILGVTVLTSLDDVHWAEVTKALTGHAAVLEDSVQGLTEHAVSWGADGVVCSALELESVRNRFPSIYTVVPGIRLASDPADDQARVMTPAQAHQLGASAVVMGRPISRSSDSRAVAKTVLAELGHTFCE